MSRWGILALVVGALLTAGCDREHAADADGRPMVLPGSLDFARVAMYAGKSMDLSLRNVGRARLTVQKMWVEGADGQTFDAQFENDDAEPLLPAAERRLHVHFAPTTEGQRLAALYVRTDSRTLPVLKVDLSGVGVDARAQVSAQELDFGRIEAQSKKALSLTFTNPTDIPISVRADPTGPDAAEFDGPQIDLGPNESQTVQVWFKPRKVGRKTAALSVQPCANCPRFDVGLKGEALDRAVVAEPPILDFGQVPIDRFQAMRAKLHNISTEPQTVTGMQLGAGTDPSFTETPVPVPIQLQPDQSVEFDLKYTPTHMGPASGQAEFNVKSVRNPKTTVALTGWGGAAEVCVSPLSYDFGTAPVGAKLSMIVNVKNCGTNNDAPLTIRNVTFGGDGIAGEDQFNVAPVTVPRQLAAGEGMNIKVFFEPTRVGGASGYLHIQTSAYSAPEVKVAFAGNAVPAGACTISITPVQVDFGTVAPGRGAVLGIKVENRAVDVCPVKNIQLVDDGGGTFSMPGGPIDGLLVPPGEYFSFQVAFVAPSQGGRFEGTLQIESGDTVTPRTLVPLHANSQPSCLVAIPSYLDFGTARPDCPPAPLQVRLLNRCSQALTVNGASIGPGTTDGEFALEGVNPGTPYTLAPGEAMTATVSYKAQVLGMNLSPLYVDVPSLAKPYLVPLLGESSNKEDQTDKFVQQDGHKVDVLFIVDNTASMVEEQPRLVSAIPSFTQTALSKGVDLHVAVTTTGINEVSNACPGGALGGEAGRLFPADNSMPRILTDGTPNLATQLQNNVQVGRCAYWEQGLEAMRRALSDPLVDNADDPVTALPSDGNLGFLRNEAALAVVVVGDEDDHSPDDVQTYVNFLRTVKGIGQPQRAVIYAIAPTDQTCSTAGGTGTRYAQAAQLTGGDVLNVCAQDYSPLLSEVAAKVFSPQDRFPLSAHPEPATIAVTVNGTAQTTGWSYDAGTNSVVFSSLPPSGAQISITYRKVCGQ